MSAFNPLLLSHLKRDRVAHAYLFSGPDTAANEALALQFARALNCENGAPHVGAHDANVGAVREPPLQQCDCNPCRRISGGNHPDVRWFGEDPKARSIKIEEVRALIHEVSLRPFEAQRKVFVLKDAERLTPDAANALLKTLEEPPGHSVLVLLVKNKFHLLDTIQSRSIEVRVPPLSDELSQSASLDVLNKHGWQRFLEGVRSADRQEMNEQLNGLMLFLRDRAVSDWERDPGKSARFLEAIDTVYETQQAVAANVNQKLAVTHLEIHLGKIFHE